MYDAYKQPNFLGKPVFLGVPVSNPFGKFLMFLLGGMFIVGACLYGIILVPMHLVLRKLGLKGIFLRDGYLINIDEEFANSVDTE